MTNMMLHCGANAATEVEVFEVPTPEPTETWQPISHRLLIETILDQLTGLGYEAKNREFGLWLEGARMFATFELFNGQNADDYSLVVGLRNSHDKAFSAGLAVGGRVFVCDNLAFSGEITIARKHTRWIERDLPRLAAQAVGKIGNMRVRQDERIAAYKVAEVDDRMAHDLLLRSVDASVIANGTVPKVLGQWRKPLHEAFEARNAWSLLNAYTEVLKGSNALELPRRTTRLYGLLDQVAGVIAPAAAIGAGSTDVDVRVN